MNSPSIVAGTGSSAGTTDGSTKPRGAEPTPLLLGQIRQQARPALVLKLTEGSVRPIGRLLRKEIRRQLRRAGKGRNEEVIQFRFHLFVL